MCAVSIPLKPGGCCLQEAGREGVSEETAGLVCCSHTGAHTPTQTSALTALSFIHCYTNKQGRLFPVQRFTDVGERRRCSAEKQTNPSWKPTLWYGGSPVPEYSFILFNENILCFYSFWVHFILNIEVKWDRWTTAVKDVWLAHLCVTRTRWERESL